MRENSSACCHIPVSGYMVRQPDGSFALDPERSTYADVPADIVARFLIDRFGANLVEKTRKPQEGWL